LSLNSAFAIIDLYAKISDLNILADIFKKTNVIG
jgi:hypothetical protein